MRRYRRHFSTLKFLLTSIVATMTLLSLHGCGSQDDDLPANVDYSLIEDLNEPYHAYEPALGAAVPRTQAKSLKVASLPYPPFNPHDIKTVGPEGWGDREQLLNTGIGGVKFNLLWSQWQPKPDLDPDDPNTFTYDGKVWVISSSREKQIRWYSERGIKVTAVIYGTPAWARKKNTAKYAKLPLVDKKFIAPDNPADFARFAGMLARRFNGANGNGRIVNFVVQNEVNALDWYNPGCGAKAHPCKIEDRINSYAKLFNLTYDKIIAEQQHARVMYSFDHHFGEAYTEHQRFTSAKRFIEELQPQVGDRKWHMAFHSYPPNLFKPEFGPYDYPKITFGNLGRLAAYLRQTFPDKPHTWDIHLTENGINSTAPSSENAMKSQLKVATRNILGTPGIETFYYHRLEDHPHEGNFTPGLFNANDTPKKAWSIWSSNNLHHHKPPQLDDGYELLPYVRLERSRHPQKGHWASTRKAPAGYEAKASYLLLREPAADTTLLYECHDDRVKTTYISKKLGCNGDQNFGPVGYIYNATADKRAALYTIRLAGSGYLITTDKNEAGGDSTLLGYVDTNRVRKQEFPARDRAFFDTDAGSVAQQNNNQTPAKFVRSSWDECADEESAVCSYLQFDIQPDQTHSLSCRRAQSKPNVTLNFGNRKRSVVRNVIIDNDGGKYTIPLYIDDDATWASISLTSDTDDLPRCSVISEGGLQIGSVVGSNIDGLLYNGSFETKISDWQFCDEDAADVVIDDAQHGSQAVEIADGNCVFQIVDVTPGEEYTMTCHAYNSTDEATLRFAMASNSYQTLADNIQTVDGSSYEQYSTTLAAPQLSNYAVLTFETAGIATLDNCSIKRVE